MGMAKKGGLLVTLWTSVRHVLSSNIMQGFSLSWLKSLYFPYTLQTNSRIVPHLCHDSFLSDPSQYISHPPIGHYIDNVVNSPSHQMEVGGGGRGLGCIRIMRYIINMWVMSSCKSEDGFQLVGGFWYHQLPQVLHVVNRFLRKVNRLQVCTSS